MATVFLHFSPEDAGLGSSVAEALRAEGMSELYVDPSGVGQAWLDALRAGDRACRVVLDLVTEAWLAGSDLFDETHAAQKMGKPTLALILVEEAALDAPARERLERVRRGPWIDGRALRQEGGLGGAPDEPARAALLGALRSLGSVSAVGLDPSTFAIHRDRRPSPYQGLAPYDDDDADAARFFGRSRELVEVLETLRAQRAAEDRRTLVICGPPGVGKSSLLGAGVLPRLRREAPAWTVLGPLTPGPDALLRLARVLGTESAEDQRADLMSVWADGRAEAGAEAVATRLRTEADRIRWTSQQPHSTLLLAIDDADALLTDGSDSASALRAYLTAATRAPRVWQLVLAARADRFDALENALGGVRLERYDLRPVPTFRFDEVIAGPARRYRADVDPGLIFDVAEDAPAQSGLPLVGLAMTRLWSEKGPTDALASAQYRARGRLQGLVDEVAEQALGGDHCPEVDAALDGLGARTFVPALLDLDDASALVSSPASWSSFSEDAQALLTRFEGAHLVARDLDSGSVEVCALPVFERWRRLSTWLQPRREEVEARRALTEAAAAWDRGGRRATQLAHAGDRLARARRWRPTPSTTEQAYLQACEASKAAARRRRRGLAGLAAASLLGGAAWLNRATLEAQWQTWMVERPFRVEHFEPYALDARRERALKPGDIFRECKAGCPEMVVIPPGSYMMGDELGQDPERLPLHRVTIPRPFAVSRMEVSLSEYFVCKDFGDCRGLTNKWRRVDPRHPVASLKPGEMKAYLRWLSRMTGRRYRLLSSAEWEYVARAGSTTTYHWGDTYIPGRANCFQGCGSPYEDGDFEAVVDFLYATAPVGSFPPNDWGVFDMHGNLWELVQDCWHPNYEGAPDDGSAWRAADGGHCQGTEMRGGSWQAGPFGIRASAREWTPNTAATDKFGIRVARDLDVYPKRSPPP